MDISEPNNSRLLAKLIQKIPVEARGRFRERALRANNIKEFAQSLRDDPLQ